MRRPMAFTVSTMVVLAFAGVIFYLYGLPMLTESSVGCRYGGSTKTLGCSTSFGTFMTFLGAGVALALAAMWNAFGKY